MSLKCPACGDYVWRDEKLALTWFGATYYVCSMKCHDLWRRILLGYRNGGEIPP